jgi:hypothetical protein
MTAHDHIAHLHRLIDELDEQYMHTDPTEEDFEELDHFVGRLVTARHGYDDPRAGGMVQVNDLKKGNVIEYMDEERIVQHDPVEEEPGLYRVVLRKEGSQLATWIDTRQRLRLVR